ncbi:MAG: hypothetical protein PHQ39_05535 [Methanothrix soehngenii]|nr:hypothetical protein [Methanothrix soehngenii]
MNCIIEIFSAEVRVSQGDVSGQDLSPAGDLFQEDDIYRRRTSFALLICGVLVKGPLQNGIFGEYTGDFIPTSQVILVIQIKNPGVGGFIRLIRFYIAIIDSELLKIGENR